MEATTNRPIIHERVTIIKEKQAKTASPWRWLWNLLNLLFMIASIGFVTYVLKKKFFDGGYLYDELTPPRHHFQIRLPTFPSPPLFTPLSIHLHANNYTSELHQLLHSPDMQISLEFAKKDVEELKKLAEVLHSPSPKSFSDVLSTDVKSQYPVHTPEGKAEYIIDVWRSLETSVSQLREKIAQKRALQKALSNYVDQLNGIISKVEHAPLGRSKEILQAALQKLDDAAARVRDAEAAYNNTAAQLRQFDIQHSPQTLDELQKQYKESEVLLAGSVENLGQLKQQKKDLENRLKEIERDISQLQPFPTATLVTSQNEVQLEQHSKQREQLTNRIGGLESKLHAKEHAYSLFMDTLRDIDRLLNLEAKVFSYDDIINHKTQELEKLKQQLVDIQTTPVTNVLDNKEDETLIEQARTFQQNTKRMAIAETEQMIASLKVVHQHLGDDTSVHFRQQIEQRANAIHDQIKDLQKELASCKEQLHKQEEQEATVRNSHQQRQQEIQRIQQMKIDLEQAKTQNALKLEQIQRELAAMEHTEQRNRRALEIIQKQMQEQALSHAQQQQGKNALNNALLANHAKVEQEKAEFARILQQQQLEAQVAVREWQHHAHVFDHYRLAKQSIADVLLDLKDIEHQIIHLTHEMQKRVIA